MMADTSEETNESLQADEIQALSAIYEDEWKTESSDQKVFSIKVTNSDKNTVSLQVTLPESYPLNSPPIYIISAPWMSREAKRNLCSTLENVYCQNIGRSILYLWIETIRSFIEDSSMNAFNESKKMIEEDISLPSDICDNASEVNGHIFDEIPPIEHGEPIIDRKSVFQAHVAPVVSLNQVNQVLQTLKENRKIAVATHNIFAYRISKGDSKTFIQDCDDDGEAKAGASLLHFLKLVDVSDVLVVVSRWYGGIHLGADRFRHINNAARNLLSKLGYIEKSQATSKKSKKS